MVTTPTTRIVSTAAELNAALKAARPGDTIALKSGNYGDVVLNRLNFADKVTITSFDDKHPATFDTIRVLNSSGITFDKIAVQLTEAATQKTGSIAFYVQNSQTIALTNSSLTGRDATIGVDPSAKVLDASGLVLGKPVGRGVSILGSSDVTISNNDISTFHKGITPYKVNGLVITGNEIHDLRTSPISGGGVDNVVISDNHFHDFEPWNFGGKGDHGDYIHLWTVKDYGDGPSSNIVITNNFLDQGKQDPLLGIYLDDNGLGIGFEKVVITNNVISNANAQAVRLERVEGIVSQNTMVQARQTRYNDAPGVLALDGSKIVLSDNLLSRITVDKTSSADQSGNTLITRLDPKADNYYTKYFVNGLAENPTLADLARFSGDAGALMSLATAAQEAAAKGGAVVTPPVIVPVVPAKPEPVKPVVEATKPIVDAPIAQKPIEALPPKVAEKLTVTGSAVKDSLTDKGLAATLVGLGGNDTYTVGHAGTTIVEAANGGTDTVFAKVDYALSANLENLTLTGSAITGTGNDLDNSIKGNELDNVLHGMGGDDLMSGGAGNDKLYGGDGNDYMNGNEGDDFLDGGNGNDTLLGGEGNDVLVGGAGNDTLNGGSGADRMTGGAGADKFLFNPGDFPTDGGMDWILDFSSAQGDKIALNAIDAKVATAADDKFAFIGTAEFSHKAGELRYAVVGGDTFVSGDTNGDGVADFTIALKGQLALKSSDFIL